MHFIKIVLLSVFSLISINQSCAQQNSPIITGADQTDKYLPILKGKRIGVLANPTTIIGDKHLVDSLLNRGVNLVKAFGPEHGFRGNASAGIKVGDERDESTGIKIVSLYGKKRKPSAEDLADIDLMIFDVQDVGCRFYTYINVLRDVMEACAENKKPMLILDRPNPNGYLIDGPVMDMRLKSGIGQFPIPMTHGMTIGEFAQMINGEGWLPNGLKADIQVIPVANYNHEMEYVLPVKPSPNLNTQQSIMVYPATCLFEGTILSQGRGTMIPFTVLGAPLLKGKYDFNFTPKSIKGMAETPLHQDQICYGLDLRNVDIQKLREKKRINIEWMIELYKAYPVKEKFFDRSQSKQMNNIDYLAGVYDFKKQIEAGVSAEDIRASWEPGLSQYKEMRKKYLIYE
jgi:uncharacterized protein YbbC (DUF1343 family)